MKMTERTPPITRTFTIEVDDKEATILSVALEKLAITYNEFSFIPEALEMRRIIMRCRHPTTYKK